MRRGLVATEEIKSGSGLTDKNVALKRPAMGISPKFLELVKKSVVKRGVAKGEPITWDML